MESKPVIFLSGSGRSGTNITKAIFNKHSEVATLPFEYRFSIDPKGVVDFYNSYSSNWSPYMVSTQLKELEAYLYSLAKKNSFKAWLSGILKSKFDRGRLISPFPYSGWELEKCMPGFEGFVDELIAQLVPFKYRANWPGEKGLQYKNELYYGPYLEKEDLKAILIPFLNNCITSNLQLQDKEFFIEDNTWSILYADSLFELFPNSKMIHIIRDPRDVIASLLKQRWSPDNLKQVVEWYRSIMKKWFAIYDKVETNRVLEVRLEDLIEDPRNMVNRMCQFSGISFEEAMLEVKLNKSNAGRYKKELSGVQIEYLETELVDVLNRYNY